MIPLPSPVESWWPGEHCVERAGSAVSGVLRGRGEGVGAVDMIQVSVLAPWGMLAI